MKTKMLIFAVALIVLGGGLTRQAVPPSFVHGRDSFEFRYAFRLPALDSPARLWLPVAESDRFQTVQVKASSVPGKVTAIRDRFYGNRILYAELGPADSGKTAEVVYIALRREEEPYAPDKGRKEAEKEVALRPERLVPRDQRLADVAARVASRKKGDQARARALYFHVVDSLSYRPAGPGVGRGDALFAFRTGGGNAADFHGFFTGLARETGIPARFCVGVSIPAGLDEGAVGGFLAWAEFWADGTWRPVDASEADRRPDHLNAYFGRLPANRLQLSRGRDLQVDPMPVTGPINILAAPLLEVDGKTMSLETECSFKRNDLSRLLGQIMRRFGG